MGDHIDRVEWHTMSRSQMDALMGNCTSVTSLKLVRPKRILHYRSIEDHSPFFYNIVSLKIVASAIYDRALRLITNISAIRTFHLIQCHNVRGRFLEDWQRSFIYDGKFNWRWDFRQLPRDSVQHLEIVECGEAEYSVEVLISKNISMFAV